MKDRRNETRGPSGNETRCLHCGAPLMPARTGRKPKFCSAAHRVAHHRHRRRRGSLEAVPTTAVGSRSHADTLDELEEAISALPPVRGAATLRSLAETADELAVFLDHAAEAEWAVVDLPDVVDCLHDLGRHRDTLGDLSGLGFLADELDGLAHAVRALRRRRDELVDAADDARSSAFEE